MVWWNYLCFASIGIRASKENNKGDRVVRFTPPTGARDIVEKSISATSEVKFIIETTERIYRFGYQENSGHDSMEWIWLGEVDTQVLTREPEVGQPFTGMMFGLYAFGELEPVLTPATFAYAEFR